jgi:hypothetical protein
MFDTVSAEPCEPYQPRGPTYSDERLETSLTPTARGKRRYVGVPVHDHSQLHRVVPTKGNDALEAGFNTAEDPTVTSMYCLGDANTGEAIARAEDPARSEMH